MTEASSESARWAAQRSLLSVTTALQAVCVSAVEVNMRCPILLLTLGLVNAQNYGDVYNEMLTLDDWDEESLELDSSYGGYFRQLGAGSSAGSTYGSSPGGSYGSSSGGGDNIATSTAGSSASTTTPPTTPPCRCR